MGAVRWLDLAVIVVYMLVLMSLGIRVSPCHPPQQRYLHRLSRIGVTLNGGKLWNLGRFNFPLHDYMIGVLGHVILLCVGLTASLFFPNRDADSKRLTLREWRRTTA